MATRWATGDRFGRYRIEGLLGRGGMGEVYLAEDTQLGRRVALKILHGAGDDAKLLREARAAAAIDHPNVARVFDVDTVEGVPFLAMELVEGKSLRTFVGDESVTLETKVKWLVAIGRALEAAHARGIVHRDVKPENVIVGDDGVVKVLDFGIARVVPIVDRGAETRTGPGTPGPVVAAATADAEGPPGATRGTTVKGTLAYMAPEQIRGETIDASADQWAWGVVAYELLTGRWPWRAQGDDLSLVAEILSKEPEAIRGAGAALDQALRRALQKRRGDRFANLGHALSALREGALQADADTKNSTFSASLSLVASILACSLVFAGVSLLRRSVGSGTPPPALAPKANPGFPDFGSPMSANADALAAYRIGVEATRNAEMPNSTLAALTRARHLDPMFAAASLRALLLMRPNEGGYEVFNEVFAQRDRLGQHDRALLEAIGPWFRAPHDVGELQRRLDTLAERDDADYAEQRCRMLLQAGAWSRAYDACTRAEASSPEAPSNYMGEARALKRLGNTNGARQAFTACLAHSSKASSCMLGLADIAAAEGRCDEYASRTGEIADLFPDDADSRRMHALAIFDRDFSSIHKQDESRAEIDRYLQLYEEQGAPPTDVKLEHLYYSGLAHASNGALSEANADFEAVSAIYERRNQEAEITSVYWLELQLLIETGQRAKAINLARIWLRDWPTWVPSPYADTRILAFETLYLLEEFTHERLVAVRRSWSANTYRYAPDGPSALWTAAYGASIRSAADAREALSARPAVTPGPGESFDVDFTMGIAYGVAGDARAAIDRLQAVTQSCPAGMLRPAAYVQAYAALGDAYASTSDRRAACDAYQVVLRHWGRTPGSVTAAHAREQRSRLACASDENPLSQ